MAGQPAQLLLAGTAVVDLGNGDGNAVAIPRLFNCSRQTARARIEHAHGFDVDIAE